MKPQVYLDYRACPSADRNVLKLPEVFTRYDDFRNDAQYAQAAKDDQSKFGLAILDQEPNPDTAAAGTIPYLSTWTVGRFGKVVHEDVGMVNAEKAYWSRRAQEGWAIFPLPWMFQYAYTYGHFEDRQYLAQDISLAADTFKGTKVVCPGPYWDHPDLLSWEKDWALMLYLWKGITPDAEIVPFINPFWLPSYDTPVDSTGDNKGYIGDERLNTMLDEVIPWCKRLVLWFDGIDYNAPKAQAAFKVLRKRGLVP